MNLHRMHLNYSMKNIPIPSRTVYRKCLVNEKRHLFYPTYDGN